MLWQLRSQPTGSRPRGHLHRAHLVRPPEGVHARDLVLLELLAHAPPAVIGQRVAVLKGEQ